MENDFRIKHAKERVIFQYEGNERTTGKKLNLKKKIGDGKFVRGSFLKRTKGVKRKILATSGCFISSVLTVTSGSRLTLIKYSSFLGDKNIKSVTRIWGQNSGN